MTTDRVPALYCTALREKGGQLVGFLLRRTASVLRTSDWKIGKGGDLRLRRALRRD